MSKSASRTAEPAWVPPANDRVHWENEAWGRGERFAQGGAVATATGEDPATILRQHRAELKLISALLQSYEVEAKLRRAQLDSIAADVKEIKAQLGLAVAGEHTIEPPPNHDLNPVFDVHGHEIDYAAPMAELDYPLVSTCRCGRQIMQAPPAYSWQHSD